MGVKRRYEAERWHLEDAKKGEDYMTDRIKKAKYDRKKKRVNNTNTVRRKYFYKWSIS